MLLTVSDSTSQLCFQSSMIVNMTKIPDKDELEVESHKVSLHLIL